MNIIDLYKEINSKSPNWNVDVSSKINENETITIMVPGCPYLFEISQDDQIPDIICGVIYVNGDTHKPIKQCYLYEGDDDIVEVEAVAKNIISDIQTEMVDRDA